MKHSRLEELRTRAKLRVKSAAKAGKTLTLKSALEEAAQKAGYADWRALKQDFEWMDAVYPPGYSRMLNLWFSSPGQAREHLEAKGGTLVPYGRQSFICDGDYLKQLGLLEGDADLLAVGADWSRPRDIAAWKRLTMRLLDASRGKS